MIIDLVVKATVLLAVAWIAALALRSRTASTRHAVWIGLMTATLLLPAMAWLAPAINVPLLPAPSQTSPAPRINVTRIGPHELMAASERNGQENGRTRIVLPEVKGATQEETPAPSRLTPRNLLIGAWLLVALALAIRIVLAHVQAQRLLRACTDPSERLHAAAASVAASLGITPPPVRIAPAGMMPAVIGVRRPAIVLPAEAAAWSDERLGLVLLHECAHVRRRDAVMQVVAGLATSAYWWHPLAWVAARHIVRERELACDDMVIASGTPAQRYAEHLLDIARSLKSARQPALAALAMARPSQLEGRLIALLEERPRAARPARALATGLLLALVAVSIVAPLKLVARAVTGTTFDEDLSLSSQAAGSQTVTPPPAQTRPEPDTAARAQIDKNLIDALTKTLKDMDESVRAMAVSALGANLRDYSRLVDLLSPLLADVSADVRASVVSSLVQTESPQVSALLVKALEDADPDVRQLALGGLVRLDRPEVIPHLAAALRDASEDVRAMAVIGIDNLNHPQRHALLLQAVADASEDVRALVALTLADETGADVQAALARLAQDPIADVRAAAVMAMASMARDADIEPLLALLRDRDSDVRAAAAIGLGSIANKSALSGLMQALRDADADVRASAAIALGSIGDPAALTALTAALSDADADVRKSAITAAASIGGDWQAKINVTSTLAGTVAGTISGTLQGTLWGGYRGHEQPHEVLAEGLVEIDGFARGKGVHRWREGLTVQQLLSATGGLTELGTMDGLIVRRRVGNKFVDMPAGESTVLHDGDKLIVARKR